MFIRLSGWQALRVWLGLLTMAGVTGCVQVPDAAQTSAVRRLQAALVSLSPTVRPDEAGVAAECAFEYSRSLAQQYRVVRPAILHNLLVNGGFKQRGLCYQWAEDLLAQLQTLKLDTLEWHWGIARAHTVREHNCLVATACGQPFEQGIVLDPWRRSGRLVWARVADDKYPWVKGELVPALPSPNSDEAGPPCPPVFAPVLLGVSF